MNKIIISAKTQEEYDSVMKKLEELGARWRGDKILPTEQSFWHEYKENTSISFEDDMIGYSDAKYHKEGSDYKDFKFMTAEEFLKQDLSPKFVIVGRGKVDCFDFFSTKEEVTKFIKFIADETKRSKIQIVEIKSIQDVTFKRVPVIFQESKSLEAPAKVEITKKKK